MSSSVPLYSNDLSDLRWLEVRASAVASSTFKGRTGVRLDTGFVTVPTLDLESAVVEVEIAAPGPCYPGIAFRIAGETECDLAYVQPHASGQWDAIVYDPIFNGSNTWQLYHGPAFQKRASIPTKEWFDLRVEFAGEEASASVGSQPALLVPHLAHPARPGAIGIWTYRPAYFRNLRVFDNPGAGGRVSGLRQLGESGSASGGASESPGHDATGAAGGVAGLPPSLVTEWLVRGFGVVKCEPHGILVLNRYFPVTRREVTLSRIFVLDHDAEVVVSFGFSDEASLALDGEVVFTGSNTFKGFADRASRGYAELGAHRVAHSLMAGKHELTVKLGNTEPFGWGLALSVEAEGLSLLPAKPG